MRAARPASIPARSNPRRAACSTRSTITTRAGRRNDHAASTLPPVGGEGRPARRSCAGRGGGTTLAPSAPRPPPPTRTHLMPSNDLQVLIAGGGPVGLLCAWLLGRRGVRVRVFDNNA